MWRNTTYDPSILQTCADDLYEQARRVMLSTAIKYGVMTFLFCALSVSIGFLVETRGETPIPSDALKQWLGLLLVPTSTGFVVGFLNGRNKAFKLRLEAQRILCQMQIELNTRSVGK